jgi:hypothetical protein
MITAGLTTGFYFLQRLPAFYNFFHGSEEIHNQGELILDSLNLILGIVGIALMVMVFREQ